MDELTIPHRLIQQALDQLMAGRTAVVIAHRLSTIRNADLICVVQNGSIIEQGAHEQLIKQAAFTRNCIIANFWQQPSED